MCLITLYQPFIFIFSSYRFSWDQVQSLCHLRRRYIQLYASSLQKMSNVDNKEIRDIEKDLDPKVILLWRYEVYKLCENEFHSYCTVLFICLDNACDQR